MKLKDNDGEKVILPAKAKVVALEDKAILMRIVESEHGQDGKLVESENDKTAKVGDIVNFDEEGTGTVIKPTSKSSSNIKPTSQSNGSITPPSVNL